MILIHILTKPYNHDLATLQSWRAQATAAAHGLSHYLLAVVGCRDPFLILLLAANIYFCGRTQHFPGRVFCYLFLSGINFMADLNLSVVEKLPSLDTGFSTLSHISPIDRHNLTSKKNYQLPLWQSVAVFCGVYTFYLIIKAVSRQNNRFPLFSLKKLTSTLRALLFPDIQGAAIDL